MTQCTFKSNIKAPSRNYSWRGKALIYVLWVSVCSLIYPACKANAPYYVVIYSLPGSTNIFPRFSGEGGCGVIEDKIRVFLYNFVCKMSQSTKNSARYYKCTVHRSSCKVSAFLVTFLSNLNFLHRFSKNPRMSNFRKIRPVGWAG